MKKKNVFLLVVAIIVIAVANCNNDQPSTRILDACEEVAKAFSSREGVHYSVGDDLIWGDISKCYEEGVGLCSPTYVAMVLYRSGLITEEQINQYCYHSCSEGGLPSLLEDSGWIKCEPEQVLNIKPGDILIDYGRDAVIYAGIKVDYAERKKVYWCESSCLTTETMPIECKQVDLGTYSVYVAPNIK